jgi:hypothetical protein
MQYLNWDAINAVSAELFQKQKPYPWVNIQGTLTQDGFDRLHETLPDFSLFERKVGIKRAYGQGPHDRGILHYRPGLEVPQPWKEFLAELQGEAYQRFLRRTALRRPPQAGDAYFLFQYGSGLGSELGRPDPDHG